MNAWHFHNTAKLNRRVDEPTGLADPNREQSPDELGATELGGYLLAAFVCTSAALLLAHWIATLLLPPDSLVGGAMIIVSGIAGVAISLFIPKPRVWGYFAYMLAGAFHALLLSLLIAVPVVWASHQLKLPLTETPPHDDPLFAAWSLIMFVTTAVLCVRWRAMLWESTSDPSWIRCVLLLIRSSLMGLMIGTGILFGLAVFLGLSYMAWEVYRTW